RIILAEVKTNQSNLNGPWTDSRKENMQRVINNISIVTLSETGGVTLPDSMSSFSVSIAFNWSALMSKRMCNCDSLFLTGLLPDRICCSIFIFSFLSDAIYCRIIFKTYHYLFI